MKQKGYDKDEISNALGYLKTRHFTNNPELLSTTGQTNFKEDLNKRLIPDIKNFVIQLSVFILITFSLNNLVMGSNFDKNKWLEISAIFAIYYVIDNNQVRKRLKSIIQKPKQVRKIIVSLAKELEVK